MTAADIASGIDTSTVAGHNLRALLLRLADGDRLRDASNADVAACVDAEPLGLIETTFAPALTPLGREVAERLRPEPWVVVGLIGSVFGVKRTCDACSLILCDVSADAERIAALLTGDDLRAAKAYKAEGP